MSTYDKNLQGALDFLILSQNIDGGWGYHRDGMSYTEPTAFSLLALLNPAIAPKLSASDPRYSAIQKGLGWLRQGQHADGGWGVFREDETSAWMTYPAAWLLNILLHFPELATAYGRSEDVAARDRAQQWIINRGREPAIESVAVFNEVRKLFKIDSNLRGWSWGTQEAGWVIPTSLALVALAYGNPTTSNTDVVKNGKDYLRDRACPDGGWNVGNPWMLDKQLPPTPDATSFALLAWRVVLNASDFGTTGQLQKAIGVLTDFVKNSNSDQTIVLGTLALRLFDDTTASLDTMIKGVTRPFGPEKVQKKTAKGQDAVTGGWVNSPYTTAFAALALSETRYYIQPT